MEPSSLPTSPYTIWQTRLRSGDLLLCQGTSPMSQLIQHATQSRWSHVGLLWRLEGLQRVLVLESVESIGVRAVAMEQYVTNYADTGQPYPGIVCVARHTRFPTDAVLLQRLSQEAVTLLGTRYDGREIAGIALRIMGQVLGMPPHAPHANTRLICSEFVQRLYAQVGLDIPYDPRGFIAPKDFATCPDIVVLGAVHDVHATEEPPCP